MACGAATRKTLKGEADEGKLCRNLALKKTLAFKCISRNSDQNPQHYGVHGNGVQPTTKRRMPNSLCLAMKLLKKKNIKKK